jgi:hypothetical protein
MALQPRSGLGLLFWGFLITHTIRHTVGLLWTSDQPVTETSTYTGQHNIWTQETNIHVPSGIRTRDPSNQAAAELRLRPRGHWDRHRKTCVYMEIRATFTFWRRRRSPPKCFRSLIMNSITGIHNTLYLWLCSSCPGSIRTQGVLQYLKIPAGTRHLWYNIDNFFYS